MKKGIVILLVLLVATALSLTVLAGCGGTSNADATATLKADLQKFQESLQAMLNPSIYTDPSQLTSAWSNVRTAYTNVVTSAQGVKNVRVTDFQNAWGDLSKAVKNLSGSQSIQEKTAAMTTALQEVQKAWQGLTSGLNPSQ
jgi:hypothetical protein